MSSILSSLLGEVRKGAISSTAASTTSPQKRAVVSGTSSTTTPTPASGTSIIKDVTKRSQSKRVERISPSTVAQRAVIRKVISPSRDQDVESVSPLCRPTALAARDNRSVRLLPPREPKACNTSLDDGERTGKSVAPTVPAHEIPARLPTPAGGSHRATRATSPRCPRPEHPSRSSPYRAHAGEHQPIPEMRHPEKGFTADPVSTQPREAQVQRQASSLCVATSAVPSINPSRSLGTRQASEVCVKEVARPQRALKPNPSTTLIKKRSRLTQAAYKNMTVGDLRVKARRRSIQLIDDSKHYLITVLMFYDEEYDQLYTRIGNPCECESYARAAVEHHNKQILVEQADRRPTTAKLDSERKFENLEESVSAGKPKSVSKMARSTRIVSKSIEESVKVKDTMTSRQKPAHVIAERKSRSSTDSGYSTGVSMMPTPPAKVDPSKLEIPKGKKRTLPSDGDNTVKPSKKAKLATMGQETPRVVKKTQQQPARSQKEERSRSTRADKGPSKSTSVLGRSITKIDAKQTPAKRALKGNKENRSPKEEAPPRGVAQPVSRSTHRKPPAEPRKTLGKRKARVEESESESSSESEDDWLVNDLQARPKKKVNRGVNRFLAGMR